nr:hypothetical protein [Myxococcota bacterium]
MNVRDAGLKVERAYGVVRKLFGTRRRRWTLGRNRAQIEMRELDPRETEAFERALRLGFERLNRVQWVDVCPEIGRVIVAFEDDAYTLEELLGVIVSAE